MSRNYRIRRVEDADAVIDAKAILRSVLGLEAAQPAPVPQRRPGSISFAAIADQHMAGSITLARPSGGDGMAEVDQLEVDAAHETLGCREALLDVALHWARANDFGALQATVPARSAGSLPDFYLANGFQLVGSHRAPGETAAELVFVLRLADARPHSDAWYSKHHGAWFASMAARG